MSKHTHDSKTHEPNGAVSPMNEEMAATGSGQKSGVPATDIPAALEATSGTDTPPKVESAPEAESVAGQPQESTELETLKAELDQTKQKLAATLSELSELNEKYLRKLADEVNFRKRMLREKEEAQKFAVSSLLGDLIPILDDFDRGISSAESAQNYEQLHEGILLIRRQLSQMLENKYALKRFESKGTAFDPNRHEALFAEPDDVEEVMVSEEYLPGYALHDRVLRTAKVRVKIPAPQKNGEAAVEPLADQEETKKSEAADSAGPASNLKS